MLRAQHEMRCTILGPFPTVVQTPHSYNASYHCCSKTRCVQDPSKQAENVLPRSHSATPGNSRRHSSAETPPLPINTDASSLTSYDPPDPEDPYNSLTQPKSRCPDCGSISQQPNSIGAPPDSGNSNPNPPCSTCSHRAMHHAAVASMRDSRETVSTNLGTTIGSNATISTTATTVGGGTMHASNASYPSGAMHAAVMSGEREPSEKSGPTNPTGREQAESTGSHSILSMNSMNSFPPKSTLRTEMIEKFAFMGPAVWRARWNGEPAVVKRITMAVTGVQEAADVAEAAQLVATGVLRLYLCDLYCFSSLKRTFRGHVRDRSHTGYDRFNDLSTRYTGALDPSWIRECF